MLADFVITIHRDDRPDRAVQVKVHKDALYLRSAVTQRGRLHGNRKKKAPAADKDLLGVCERFQTIMRNGETAPLCAIVRFAPPDIGIGIVTHELAHAAVHIWNLDHPGEILDDENDEDFCWNLGDLVRQTVNKLYEKEIYPG
jgi:hypothetical protein